MKRRTIISICIGLIFFTACKKKNNFTPVCDGSNATYNSTVATILANNCTGCHSNYSSFIGISTITSNGKFEQEVLTNQNMPKDNTLSESDLNKLKCWLENGFPEN